MKLIGIAGGILLIGGLGLVAYLSLKTGGEPTESISATATTLKTDLFLTPVGGQEAKIEKTTPVSSGEVLRTSTTGRALLEEENGTAITLDYDTTFTFTGDATHVSGQLAGGQIWARVEKLFGKGEFYEIETGNAVAVVRGTSFSVTSREGATVVKVAGGTVALIPKDEKTGKRIPDETVFVPGGQIAFVRTSDETIFASQDPEASAIETRIDVRPLNTEEKKEEWYLLNNSAAGLPKPEALPVKDESKPAPIPTPTPKLDTTSTEKPLPDSLPTDIPKLVSPVVNNLVLISAFPSKVIKGGSVTLKGKGFLKVMAVVVGKLTLPGDAIRIVDDTQINILTGEIPAGTWSVTLIDVNKNFVSLDNAFTVETPIPPPPGTPIGPPSSTAPKP